MSNNKLPIRLRRATEEDIPFIFNSWLKSYRHSRFAREITSTIYFTEHHKVLERLLKTNDVIIACNEKDASQVYGYICAGKVDGIFAIHYIYVKHSFRNLGVGKVLLNAFQHDPATASVHSHSTRISERLAAKYNSVYHPYLILNVDDYNSEQKEEADERKE